MQIFCPSCQRQLRVPDQAVGKTVRCPACQTAFAVGSAANDAQIQAPVAPLPTARAPAPDELDEPSRPRRIRWEEDDDDLVLRGGGEDVQRLANSAALWLFITAAVTLLVAVVNILVTLAVGALQDGPFGGFADAEEFVGGLACVSCCGVMFIAVNVMIMIGAAQLRSFGAKGWVVAAIVLAFGQTLLFGGGAFINVIYLAVEPQEALADWAPLTMILSGVAALLNCFAGVKAILTLNNAGVDAEFDQHRTKRRRRKTRWQD